MRIICNTDKAFYKVSTNFGRFYEFVNKECDVTNKQDIEYFLSLANYKGGKKKGELNGI